MAPGSAATKPMAKYLKIYLLFVKNSLQLFMSHRFNFFMGIAANLIWTVSQLISLRFLFDKINTFQGWGFPDIVLLLGLGNIYYYTSFLVYDVNLSDLPRKIITGQFDRMLTKPINVKFLSSFELIMVAQFLPMSTIAIPMILFGLIGRQALTIGQILAAALILSLGIIAFYFLTLALIGLTFFIENASSLKDFATQRTAELTRIPISFFPKVVQGILSFIIPLAFVAYYPALVIRGQITPTKPILLVSAITIVFYFLQKFIWKKGLINYSGVG